MGTTCSDKTTRAELDDEASRLGIQGLFTTMGAIGTRIVDERGRLDTRAAMEAIAEATEKAVEEAARAAVETQANGAHRDDPVPA